MALNSKGTSKVASSSGLGKFKYHNYGYLLLFRRGKLQSLILQNFHLKAPKLKKWPGS